MERPEIRQVLESHLDEEDYTACSTCQTLDELIPLAEALLARQQHIDTVLELGCGRGGLTAGFADLLSCGSVHGIDRDEGRLAVATSRGVTTHRLDLATEVLPFDDGSVDLVLSFGFFEHLCSFDHPLAESRRVLGDDGFALHAVPNLASLVNRIALLCGNQPRDVEISEQGAFGIARWYGKGDVLGHPHAPTHDAFVELLEHHGFVVDDVVGLFPYQHAWYVTLADRLTSVRPTLARRIAVLAHTD